MTLEKLAFGPGVVTGLEMNQVYGNEVNISIKKYPWL